MPALIDIRRRVRAVKSTQQITKAMKMVASSKLRRAQEAIVNARPFAEQTLRVLNSLASRVDPSAHPLLAVRDEQAPGARVLLVVITADKGLCGSFNTNIVKRAGTFIAEQDGREVALALVGRKGRDFFRRRGFKPCYERINVFARLGFNDAHAVAQAAIHEFTSGRMAAVYIAYNEFKSVLRQQVVVEPLLPIPRLDLQALEPAARVDYLYEPSPKHIFNELLPRHVEVQVYRALLESAAAEHAARMVAMDNATNNASDLVDQLTLYMNKLRQAAITREIIEVISGAQAL
jgi:F-type H+-transporting ATPase subunit gamma